MKCHGCRKGIMKTDAIAKDGFYWCKNCAKKEYGIVNYTKKFSRYANTDSAKSAQELKDCLSKVREKNGYSQKRLAELLGTDQAKISRIENGKFSCYDILNWYFTNGTTHAVIKENNYGKENITSTEGNEY